MDILDQIVESLKKRNLIRSGQIEYAKRINRIEPYGYEIDLSTLRTPDLGNGLRIPAHHSFRTFDGTDETVNVTVVYDENINGKKQDTLYDNDSYECSDDEMFSGATIYNKAQSGKSLHFRSYRDMKFKNGSTKFRGTVTVNNPTAGADTLVTSSITNALLLAENTTAKKRTIRNKTGGWMYIKFESSGTVTGEYLLNGDEYVTTNTANLYQLCEFALASGISITEET